MTERELVTQLASLVRTELQRGGFRSRGLADFPEGACGDASLLLGQLLSDEGLGQWWYCTGHLNGNSHAWLERGGVIVDLTADQFGGEACFVVAAVNQTGYSPAARANARRAASLDGMGLSLDILRSDYLRLRERLAARGPR